MTFSLHPRLQEDSSSIGRLKLCQVLLVRDELYPWLILVPERADITEVYQLSEADRNQLQYESCEISRLMAGHFNADKMNVAMLGNIVPQLHIHHIARFEHDAAWPGPVWGAHPAEFREMSAQLDMVQQMQQLCGQIEGFKAG